MLGEGFTRFWNYLGTALELQKINFQALIEFNFDKFSQVLTATNPEEPKIWD